MPQKGCTKGGNDQVFSVTELGRSVLMVLVTFGRGLYYTLALVAFGSNTSDWISFLLLQKTSISDYSNSCLTINLQ